MAAKNNSANRRESPLELNLLDTDAKPRPVRGGPSLSGLNIILVLLLAILVYALLPISAVFDGTSLPNLYGYMGERKAYVASLEDELSQKENALSQLRTGFIPEAKGLVSEIGAMRGLLEDLENAYGGLFEYSLWSDVVEEIDALAPSEVDLTYIAQDGVEVVIEGYTDADRHISDYAHSLLDSEMFGDNPAVEYTYELTERARAELIQTPQMYDNWSGEAVLMTLGNGTSAPDYWAVIVGVGDYPTGSGLVDLQYTDDDAYDVRDALLGGSNWQSSHITMLIDEAATKLDIQEAIEDMGNKGGPDDVFLFYFSGHGGNVKDMSPLDEADDLDEVLCPFDYDPADPETAINDDELGSWLATLPGQPVLVALDTCYSGGMVKGSPARVKGFGEAMSPLEGDGFSKDLYGLIDGVVLTACDDDEVSYEDPILQNGVFTHYLVEGLDGSADANNDNLISMEEAFAYLYWRVTGYAPPFSFTITVRLDKVGEAQ